MILRFAWIPVLAMLSCSQKENDREGTYQHDVAFLKKHNRTVVELSSGKARVLISGDYQGRVMTSSSNGEEGTGYGWINYDLIASGKKLKQFNPVGGEERFWLGPEGGQYSLYFAPGDSFLIKNWQVPALLDTTSFNLESHSTSSATFTKSASLTNYSGGVFDLNITRTLSLIDQQQLSTLGVSITNNISWVAYQSENIIENSGDNTWTKESGLLSVWLLGMFTPSSATTVIIPFKPIPQAQEFITSNYFGEIPADRLTIQDSTLFFICDGKHRSKIGLAPDIAKPIAASFDFEKNILTLVIFNVQPEASYVNSTWTIQSNPFQGDVVNAYNDGPLADGSQLGPFYELESSSPALALNPGQAETYKQITLHAQGDFDALNHVAQKTLGIDLRQLKK